MAGQDLSTIVHCRNEVLRMGRAENRRGSDSDQQGPTCEMRMTLASDLVFQEAQLLLLFLLVNTAHPFSEGICCGSRSALIVVYFALRRRRRTRIAICLTR